MITLRYTFDQKDEADSVKVTNGKFSFKGSLIEPVFATLVFIPTDKTIKGEYRELYLDPAEISISGNAGITNANIKGGKSMDEFAIAVDGYKDIAVKGTELDKQIAKAREEDDEEKMKELGAAYMKLKAEKTAAQESFIKSHPDSYVAFNRWVQRTYAFIDPAVIAPEFNAFSPRMKNSVEGKKVAEKLTTISKLLPGKMAPDFTLNDVSGKPVSLSSLKGKNVVLIFWARNYVPFEPVSFAINRMSRQFKNDNLVVLSVYYDAPNSSYEWKNVLQESALTADNIINVKDKLPLVSYDSKDRTDVMKAYGMSAETGVHAYLISPEGKILIRGIDLYKDPGADIKKELAKK